MADEQRYDPFGPGGAFDRSDIFDYQAHQQCAKCHIMTAGKFKGKRFPHEVRSIDEETGEGHTKADMEFHGLPENTGHGLCEDCVKDTVKEYRVNANRRKESEEQLQQQQAEMDERQRQHQAEMDERQRRYQAEMDERAVEQQQRDAAATERARQHQAEMDERQRQHAQRMAARDVEQSADDSQ